jgi:transposase
MLFYYILNIYGGDVCILNDAGNILENFNIQNNVPELNNFILKYKKLKPEIAVEASTSGKFVARSLENASMTVHFANPAGIAAIYSSAKKTEKNDAYILAKLLRIDELPESYLPSKEIDDMRTLVRYRKSLEEDMTAIKNRVHSLLTLNGIRIEGATDIFGSRGLNMISKY